ncbi:hypothetical protein CRUP_024568, partial [Coryphaenoides rupestris]
MWVTLAYSVSLCPDQAPQIGPKDRPLRPVPADRAPETIPETGPSDRPLRPGPSDRSLRPAPQTGSSARAPQTGRIISLMDMLMSRVAVKVIDKRKAKKDSYVTKNLRREGHIQQMIRHPNITQLLDILETENSYYLVMELCPGGNLMNRIYDKNRLEERETQKYVRQLVMAVEHLHRAGVVHRDLKIENLLLDEQDNIKLIDFGLSNCAGILGYSDPFSTQCGSPAYAAPELLSRKKYGPKVDVWSMVVVVVGAGGKHASHLNSRVDGDRSQSRDIVSPHGKTTDCAAICLLKKLLEPDPAKRPNIHQVMADSWLQLANKNTGAPYLNRIHIEEINHTVLLHMTERMGYKHSEVLSAVLTNRACHTLAVYFLLNNKMKRLSKEYRKFRTVSAAGLPRDTDPAPDPDPVPDPDPAPEDEEELGPVVVVVVVVAVTRHHVAVRYRHHSQDQEDGPGGRAGRTDPEDGPGGRAGRTDREDARPRKDQDQDQHIWAQESRTTRPE